MDKGTKDRAPTPTNGASSGVEIDRKTLKGLMKRNDWNGLVWCSGLVGLLVVSGFGLHYSFNSPWLILILFVYGSVLTLSTYALSHECAHGTAFKSRWLNELLFRISSFIYLEEHYHRRYTHASHHTYTYHKERDAQIPFKSPMTFTGWIKEISGFGLMSFHVGSMFRAVRGEFTNLVANCIPDSEKPKLIRNARIYMGLYVLTGIGIVAGYEFLLWYFVLPRILGAPVMLLYTILQHAEMNEDQMDLKKSTRSFNTNVVSRFLYMNMNYHIEHHMFPTVPFHALPRLNHVIESQLPEPDPGFLRTNWWVFKTVLFRSMGRRPMHNLGRTVPVS